MLLPACLLLLAFCLPLHLFSRPRLQAQGNSSRPPDAATSRATSSELRRGRKIASRATSRGGTRARLMAFLTSKRSSNRPPRPIALLFSDFDLVAAASRSSRSLPRALSLLIPLAFSFHSPKTFNSKPTEKHRSRRRGRRRARRPAAQGARGQGRRRGHRRWAHQARFRPFGRRWRRRRRRRWRRRRRRCRRGEEGGGEGGGGGGRRRHGLLALRLEICFFNKNIFLSFPRSPPPPNLTVFFLPSFEKNERE